MKTFSAKPAEVVKKWIIIDGEGVVVGRLASFIASRLRGKHLPIFTPHVDCGDNVILINADKVVFTGRKLDDKTYYRHTGYPGGIKSVTAGKLLSGKFPDRVMKKAVQRMLPKESPLARAQFSNFKVYIGSEHPHEAQKPEPVDFASMNNKNVRRD
ncbi:MAG: 50S ribosomal protein L13 [Robiginitomaculum sp.]|nr:50S ribosomal protein L13 [Robiginitomaculum sp.]